MFGDLIREKRLEHKLSLSALSAASGVPRMTIYNYEKGVKPTIDNADKILKALNLQLVLGKEQLQ